MNNYVPAITAAAKLLDCLPGEVPKRVEALLERQRMRPASEPPNDNRDVFISVQNQWRRIGYWHNGTWWCFGSSGLGTQYQVTAWWELPPVPEELTK